MLHNEHCAHHDFDPKASNSCPVHDYLPFQGTALMATQLVQSGRRDGVKHSSGDRREYDIKITYIIGNTRTMEGRSIF